MRQVWIRTMGPLFFMGFFLLFALSARYFAAHPTSLREDRLSVHFPVPMQLLMAVGDRYLAANIATLRATLVGTSRMDEDTVAMVADIHEDASWFNPAHEDNFYLAAANLPWDGQVEAAQTVLRRAAQGRPKDPYPLFYYGFNQQYFLHDFLGAARAAEQAASRVDGGGRSALLNIAAKWYERVDNPEMAAALIRDLQAKSNNPELTTHLQKRLQRVQTLEKLRAAARSYRERTGRPLQQLDELRKEGLVQALPEDPLGSGFVVSKGDVIVKRK